jgi:peptidoglycan/LPS O-acetylase OafA/YrhL
VDASVPAPGFRRFPPRTARYETRHGVVGMTALASLEPGVHARPHESANLDLLRSVAVLCVLAVHVCGFLGLVPAGSALLRVGRFGVLLFFVHTSLVLMYSLERRWRGEFWRTVWLDFLTRRAFRIYPLSILVVLVVYGFGIPSGHVRLWNIEPILAGPGALVANLLLIQNLTFSPSIVGQLWSLPLEIQMYLLLPFLFLWVQRGVALRTLLAVWVLAVGLALMQPLVSDRLSIVRFIPCFLPGIIAYRLSRTVGVRWASAAWPVCLALLALGFILSGPDQTGWVLCLLTGLGIPRFAELRGVWLRRSAHLIARYSYGLYLTHLLALWLGFSGVHAIGGGPLAQWTVFVVTLIGLPVLLYHTIEAPLIRVGARLADRWFASPAASVHFPPRVRPERLERIQGATSHHA